MTLMLGEDLSLVVLRNTLRGSLIPHTAGERTMTDPAPSRHPPATGRGAPRRSRQGEAGVGLGEVGLGGAGGGEALQPGELETVLEGGGVRGAVQQGGH